LVKRLPFVFAVVLFLLLTVVPLLFTFFSSFYPDGHFSLKNYETICNAEKLLLLSKSCLTAAAVAAISTVLGAALAWMISKTDVPFPAFFKLAFLLPLFISPYYFSVAWKDVFSLLGISNLQGKNWILIFIHTLCFFPLPLIVISSALANINRTVAEAGLLMASKRRVLFSLELPLARHAFFSSFILVFILSVSEVAVATYFLVPSFASDIFIQFAAYYNHEAAIASSLLLVLLCFALLALEYSYLMKAPFLSIGTQGNPVKKYQLKTFRAPSALLLLFLYSIITLLPVLSLGIQAFKAPPELTQVRSEIIQTEGGGQTGYYVLKAFELLKPAIPESLLYAALGAFAICAAGFTFAYFSVRKGNVFFDFILLAVFAVPATVFGIGLIKFYNRPVLDFFYSSFAIIVIAYAGRFTFIASKIISHAIGKIPYSIEEAAMINGAGVSQRFLKILLPLISEGLFAAFIISFIFCLSEVGTTIVVYPPGSSLLPVKIATAMHSTPSELMSAMVFIAMGVTLAVLALLFAAYHLLTKKKAWQQ